MDTASFQERLAAFPWVSMAALHTDTCFLHTWHEPQDDIDAAMDTVQGALGARGWAKGFRIGGDPAPMLGALDCRLVLAPSAFIVWLSLGVLGVRLPLHGP